MWFFLLACARPPLAPVTPGAPPRIPSPQSAMYVAISETPRDPIVARAWPHEVDEGLSGAAAAIGMTVSVAGSLPTGELRWRAILAGYIWPIRLASVASVPTEQLPPDMVALAEQHDTTGDIGLVRTRDGEMDTWVLLVGEPGGQLPGFAREISPGATLTFPGFETRVSEPDGDLRAGGTAVKFEQAGEYLIELSKGGIKAGSFPVHAGLRTPLAAPFAGAATAENAGDLDEEVLVRMDALDVWYKRPAAERDPMLDTVARSRLRAWVSGQTMVPATEHLAGAGYLDGFGGVCRAATVADCLDAMWWSVDDRAALSAPMAAVGWAAQPAAGGVAVVVVGQRTPL